MESKKLDIWMMTSLAILIPIPGRFGYGIFVTIFMVLLVVLGTLAKFGIEKLKLGSLASPLHIITVMFVTMISQYIFGLISPIGASALKFLIYAIMLSPLVLRIVFSTYTKKLTEQLTTNIKTLMPFLCFVFVYFFLRDFLSYGCISILTRTGIVELRILTVNFFDGFIFFSTLPGGLIIMTVFFAIFKMLTRNYFIVRSVEE